MVGGLAARAILALPPCCYRAAAVRVQCYVLRHMAVKRLPARYDEELQDLKKLLTDGLLTEEFYVAEVKYVLVRDTRPAITHGKKRTVAPRGTTHAVARLGDGCGGAGKRAAVSLQCSRASKLARV